MKRYRIMLNNIDLVKSFVGTINRYGIQANVSLGSYSVDAQSILGLFTLNLTKELLLVVHSIYPEEDIYDFERDIKPYIVAN